MAHSALKSAGFKPGGCVRTLWIAALVTFACVAPAAARPHDEAMSGVFRCAAIGDLRTWLECYYGAAQPVRAALGIAPAPAAQVRLTVAPPAGNPAPGDTAVRDAVLVDAVRCGGQADERQWLTCYYAAAEPARARLGLAPRAVPAAAQAAVVRPFGTRAKRDEIPDSAKNLSARMQSYSFDKFGVFTVTLDNGQVWRQVSGDNDFARWNKPADQYIVRITHGLFGSYNLQVSGHPGLFKVRRAS